MCRVYATTDSILYESRTRSLRIHGVLTAIRLENLFWEVLTEMAARERMTTNALIATLHDELHEERNELANFASFLRVCCLRYLSLPSTRDAARAEVRQPSLQTGTASFANN